MDFGCLSWRRSTLSLMMRLRCIHVDTWCEGESEVKKDCARWGKNRLRGPSWAQQRHEMEQMVLAGFLKLQMGSSSEGRRTWHRHPVVSGENV
jgi:hypothetical protein